MYSTLLKENPKFVYRRLLWVKLSAKTKSLYKDCLKQSFEIICLTFTTRFKFDNYFSIFLYPPLPEGGVYTVLPLSFRPSVQDIFRRFYLSNCWWQKSDIWSRASYRYTILWVAFLDPSDSYYLFANLVGFYTHWTYLHIFRHIFISNYWCQIRGGRYTVLPLFVCPSVRPRYFSSHFSQ
jgi:hypothetical protein